MPLLSPGQGESLTHVEILVGDFHGVGHAGLFLSLHQAAPQRDDTLRKNQKRRPPPHPRPAQVTQVLWEPSAIARCCPGPERKPDQNFPRGGTGGRGPRSGGGQGGLCPQKDLFSRLPDQSRTTDGTLPSEDTSPHCPHGDLPHCGPGERPPHLRMYIEVFVGFKALFFTLRVVKKKALFDDEKPIAGGGEGGATRREKG